MLCYPMLWYGMESMVGFEISMLCCEISMLCYAMVFVVKDKPSATACAADSCRCNVLGGSLSVFSREVTTPIETKIPEILQITM